MRRLVVLLLTIALALVAGRTAQAGAPTDQLKVGIDRVLAILQDPAMKQPGKAEERRQKIRAVANEVFDWEEIGKRALARHWQARTPQEREEFAKLFADLLERSYVGKIEAYSGEKIVYGEETVDGDQAAVRTKLLTKTGTQIPIDYQMQKIERSLARLRREDRERGPGRQLPVPVQPNHPAVGFNDLMQRLKTKQEELQFDEGAATKAKKP